MCLCACLSVWQLTPSCSRVALARGKASRLVRSWHEFSARWSAQCGAMALTGPLAARKAEKLLKDLQHLPCNKVCADCSGTGALGPTYVVSNFGTFVCTNCATAQCVKRSPQQPYANSLAAAQPLAQPPREGDVHVHLQPGGGVQAAGAGQRGARAFVSFLFPLLTWRQLARAQYLRSFTGQLPDNECAYTLRPHAAARADAAQERGGHCCLHKSGLRGPPLRGRPRAARCGPSGAHALRDARAALTARSRPAPLPPPAPSTTAPPRLPLRHLLGRTAWRCARRAALARRPHAPTAAAAAAAQAAAAHAAAARRLERASCCACRMGERPVRRAAAAASARPRAAAAAARLCRALLPPRRASAAAPGLRRRRLRHPARAGDGAQFVRRGCALAAGRARASARLCARSGRAARPRAAIQPFLGAGGRAARAAAASRRACAHCRHRAAACTPAACRLL